MYVTHVKLCHFNFASHTESRLHRCSYVIYLGFCEIAFISPYQPLSVLPSSFLFFNINKIYVKFPIYVIWLIFIFPFTNSVHFLCEEAYSPHLLSLRLTVMAMSRNGKQTTNKTAFVLKARCSQCAYIPASASQ